MALVGHNPDLEAIASEALDRLAGNVSPSSPIAKAIAAASETIPVEITEVMAEHVPGTPTVVAS